MNDMNNTLAALTQEGQQVELRLEEASFLGSSARKP